MSSVEKKWTDEQIASDAVSKKDIVEFLHSSASNKFLLENKLNGKIQNVVKTAKKPDLILAYNRLFETQQFRTEDEQDATLVKKESTNAAAATATKDASQAAANELQASQNQEAQVPKYKKTVVKRGSGTTPRKGDLVSVFYKGYFNDNKVFDTNITAKGKGDKPLKFKVGTGRVIRGWDEVLLTMQKGEKAVVNIEAEWAYGKKGVPQAGIPPNTPLNFEMELVDID
ncbi:Peptidyl-prolyl cis-trans isomerase FKBP3 [Zancudomyces culisetae]|uniref:peptidylprolyl isomerase n=1 Tax=Zancudomyces culisetae TaxID=1213189 RepID=A0A1R1PYL1_ZANCU|nr:Peptidyl-prolyl cis-trans isomerase FKBP3 [Zancudomyces culisetae]|eukprot:OMH86052.1 Peptidyl-prolyl cis-trans isomerase FKBP3 [Zancudomyces culisetae]